MDRVRLYPDPSLVQVAKLVNDLTSVPYIIDELVAVMYAGDGVGMAAPQLGIDARIVVIDPSAGEAPDQLVAMVNPRVEWASGESVVGDEGCLSLPNLTLSVRRAVAVRVSFMDASGDMKIANLEGWPARVAQHEIDHLDGITILDRVGALARKMALGSYRRDQ